MSNNGDRINKEKNGNRYAPSETSDQRTNFVQNCKSQNQWTQKNVNGDHLRSSADNMFKVLH